MYKTLSIGTLVAVLLSSGLWLGVSLGGQGGISEPEAIEVNTGHCGGPGVRCRFYGLRAEGRVDGQIITVNGPSKDVDGDIVGRLRETCTYEGGNTNICTQVFTMRSGPNIDRGSIVTTGVLGEWVEGLNGTFAVTGGTGAYVNVRGYATKVYDGRDFIFTLHLIP
ncbi:MAG TPA: hypothetical protein VI341_03525 [Actinomycetota bacterium]